MLYSLSKKFKLSRWFPRAGIFLSIFSIFISSLIPTYANESNSNANFRLTPSSFSGLGAISVPIFSPNLNQILICNQAGISASQQPTFKTVDFGQTFIDVSPHNLNLSACHQGLSATSYDGLHIYRDDYGLIQSHDGGVTWDNSAQTLIGCQFFDLVTGAVCPDSTTQITNITATGNGESVYVTTAQFVPNSVLNGIPEPAAFFVSHDYGKTWIKREGDASKNWIALNTTSDGSELVGLTAQIQLLSNHVGRIVNQMDLYFSRDDGQTWQSNPNLESLLAKIGVGNYGNYEAVVQSQIVSTTGESFEGLGVNSSQFYNLTSNLAISANGQVIYVAITPVLLVSTDGGKSWEERGQTLRVATKTSKQGYGYLSWRGVSTSADGKIVATSTTLDGLASTSYAFFSNNFGKTWIDPINLADLSTRSAPGCDPSIKYNSGGVPVPLVSSDGARAVVLSIGATPSLNGSVAGLCNKIFYINIPSVFPSPPPNPYNAYMGNAVPAKTSKPVNKSITCTKGSIKIKRTGANPSCPIGYKLT